MIRAIIRKYGILKLKYLLADMACFLAGGLASLSLTGSMGFVPFYRNVSVGKGFIFAVAAVLSLVSFMVHDLYKQKVFMARPKQLEILSKNAFITFVIVLMVQFFMKPADVFTFNRVQVVAFIFISYGLIAVNRLYVLRALQRSLFEAGIDSKRIVAIGAGKTGERLARTLKKSGDFGIRLVGFLDDSPALQKKRIQGVPVLGKTRDLSDVILEHNVDELFITVGALPAEKLLNLIQKCKDQKCNVNIISEHFQVIERKVVNTEFADLRYVSISRPISDLYQAFVKRAMDLVLTVILLVVLSPMLLLIALLIKLTSRGPVLYSPTCIGRHGKSFTFYKFRSMRANVSHDTHRKLVADFIKGKVVGAKLRNDPRVTRIGRFLRKYSLDEFPQLINVLKGDMSLVGPRPSTQYEYDMMEPWHRRRFEVLPGITGLWQVSGRAEVSHNDMVMMDLYYIENCSLWSDIVILFKTVAVVLKGKGGH